jgi:nicotinamidase-related amidase
MAITIPPGPVPRTQPGLHLQEEGFEVAVVGDATATARGPEGDRDLAALINVRYLADALWTTDEAVRRING